VIEEERADAVRSRRGPTPWLRTSQPASVSMGDPQFPKLDQFPGEHWFKEHLAFIPEVDIVRKHEVDVLIVLAGEHA